MHCAATLALETHHHDRWKSGGFVPVLGDINTTHGAHFLISAACGVPPAMRGMNSGMSMIEFDLWDRTHPSCRADLIPSSSSSPPPPSTTATSKTTTESPAQATTSSSCAASSSNATTAFPVGESAARAPPPPLPPSNPLQLRVRRMDLRSWLPRPRCHGHPVRELRCRLLARPAPTVSRLGLAPFCGKTTTEMPHYALSMTAPFPLKKDSPIAKIETCVAEKKVPCFSPGIVIVCDGAPSAAALRPHFELLRHGTAGIAVCVMNDGLYSWLETARENANVKGYRCEALDHSEEHSAAMEAIERAALSARLLPSHATATAVPEAVAAEAHFDPRRGHVVPMSEIFGGGALRFVVFLPTGNPPPPVMSHDAAAANAPEDHGPRPAVPPVLTTALARLPFGLLLDAFAAAVPVPQRLGGARLPL